MIALKNEDAAFTRRADAKITLLKEIIERIKNGEDVDVEGLLGTGDKDREKEWEDVLQEIEQEEEAWEKSKRSKPKHGVNLDNITPVSIKQKVEENGANPGTQSKGPSGFY